MPGTNRSWLLLISLLIVLASQSFAASEKSGSVNAGDRRWSVQVEEVESSDVNLDSVFGVAIYEHLLTELDRIGKFKTIYRSGDRSAQAEGDLFILKVSVRKFQAGSETKRAVTTIAGATKIEVQYRLETRFGETLKEDLVRADVRYFGSNMRVTQNVARNVASRIKKSKLPEPLAIG